jgi:hypothetical protein
MVCLEEPVSKKMNMAKKPPRKPTGKITQPYLVLEPGKPAVLEISGAYKLPEDKPVAEREVMAKLLDACSKRPGFFEIAGFTSIPDDGSRTPDFHITMKDGSAGFTELVEIAPLGKGGFETADRVRNVGDFLDHTIGQIRTKEQKYGGGKYAPLHLITYVSDDRFVPDDRQTVALRTLLSGEKFSAFATVHLVLFAHDGSPLVVKLWPYHREMSDNEIVILRSQQFARPDFSQAVVKETNWDGDNFNATTRVFFPKGAKLPPIFAMADPSSALKQIGADIVVKPKKK